MKLALFFGLFLLAAYTAAYVYMIAPTARLKKRRAPAVCAPKTLYLSFDDGPSVYTPQLLDLLKQYNIRASFFVVGEFAEDYPKIIERMQAEGHFIGTHSQTHRDVTLAKRAEIKRQSALPFLTLQELGVSTNAFRPPWGRVTLRSLPILKQLNVDIYSWDIMAQDWRAHTSAKRIAAKLLTRTFDGAIVCLHDGRGKNDAPTRTIEALRRVLPIWLEEGFCFQTLEVYK